MALSPIPRAAQYREIAYRLWRMSTDRSLDIGFETRSRLVTIADDLEDGVGRPNRSSKRFTVSVSTLRAIAFMVPKRARSYLRYTFGSGFLASHEKRTVCSYRSRISDIAASYKPIRDKVFAHHDLGVSVDDLFGKTLVGDIEDLLHNLNRIRTAVFQLLENGRQQWIANDDRTYTDPFIADTRNALSRLEAP